MRKQRRLKSYEELIAGRYGIGDGVGRKGPADLGDLYATYYGAAPAAAPTPAVATVQWLSISPDTPQQRTRSRTAARARGLSETIAPAAPPPDQPLPGGTLTPTPVPSEAAPSEEDRAREEAKLDLFAATVPAQAPDQPAPTGAAATRNPPAWSPPPPPAPVAKAASRSDSDAMFMADMRAIMSGQKSYDETTRTMVPRAEFPQPPDARSDAPPPPASQPAPQLPPPGGGHEIFERIAQSMEYAGAYDLGSVNLDNRFAQFDRERDGKPAPAVAPPAPVIPEPVVPPRVAPPPVDAFREDMRDMLARPQPVAPPAPPPPPEPMAAPVAAPEEHVFFPDPATLKIGALGPPATAAAQSLPEGVVARPFYDTGEHVLTGDDLYPDQLVVGEAPGVAFSYGEIIAMPDLYASVDDLNRASVAELTRLKTLIKQSAAHYRAAAGPKPSAPGNSEWTAAIGKRYLRLAEDNYDHFAPNLLFRDAAFAKRVNLHGDHWSAWRTHHQRAIGAAQAMALDPANASRSYIPVWPLTINAFGDHFLTDAFAAGHVFNKEVIADGFKSQFFTGGALNSAGDAFLGRLADKVFRGELADRFSDLETFEPLQRRWNIVNWNPNINSASRFHDLLVKIAQAEPDTVANLAVKALHDRLNTEGVMVSNRAGHKPWLLTGDGHLTPESLAVMRQAVRQSIANVTGTDILASNIDYETFFQRVWAYVPVLTADGTARVKALAPTYISPTSATLLDAAARLLTEEVSQLVTTLIDRKALKPA